jgi:hypothetical protein
MEQKRPLGVTIFGILLITTSLVQLQTVLVVGRNNYYEFLFSSLPFGFLEARYFVSLALRILGLSVGIGLFSRREIFRKAGLFLACFTIATILFKHPFIAVQKHTKSLTAMLAAQTGIYSFDNPVVINNVVFVSYLLLILVDLFFALLLLRYCTNPQVEKWFKR